MKKRVILVLCAMNSKKNSSYGFLMILFKKGNQAK